MKFALYISAVFTVIFCGAYVGATICKPHSAFKVDCNVCRCSNDGTKYSCTKNFCPISFLEDNEDGYILTKSRNYREPKVQHIDDGFPAGVEYVDNDLSGNSRDDNNPPNILIAPEQDDRITDSEELEDVSISKQNAEEYDANKNMKPKNFFYFGRDD